MLDQITPLILTLDEEANIARTLEPLRWAREIVVVDSGSKDATCSLLAAFGNVRCVEHAFDTHAAQWNYGLTQAGVRSEWVLALDADYVITEALSEELRNLKPDPGVMGYRVRFRYCVFGQQLRRTLYPPAVVLYRREAGKYVQDGHTQRLIVNGRIEWLRSSIMHDDRKDLSRWLSSQVSYAKLEADLLCDRSWSEVGWPDRLRKLLVVMPPLVFVYCLTFGRGILDGWRGLYYALQRAVAESILSLALLERRLISKMRRK